MINKESMICPYCRGENEEIRGKTFRTDDFKKNCWIQNQHTEII